MSDTDHAAIIRETLHHYLLQPIPPETPDVWEISVQQINRIIDHAESLQRERDEARNLNGATAVCCVRRLRSWSGICKDCRTMNNGRPWRSS